MTDTNWRQVQLRLDELGFDPGPIDGIRGPKTDAAIVAFKRSIGFKATPRFGPLTKAALFFQAAALDWDRQPDPSGPGWLVFAQEVRGLHEDRNTSRLRTWFHRSVAWLDPREVAWCGAFVQTVFKKWKPDIETPENPLGARNWNNWGVKVKPGFGALLVFWRIAPDDWRGHVGFYVGEDDTHYHVLGGNQSDAVTVTRIAKRRLLSARVPVGFHGSLRKVFVDRRGVPVSENEA